MKHLFDAGKLLLLDRRDVLFLSVSADAYIRSLVVLGHGAGRRQIGCS